MGSRDNMGQKINKLGWEKKETNIFLINALVKKNVQDIYMNTYVTNVIQDKTKTMQKRER